MAEHDSYSHYKKKSDRDECKNYKGKRDNGQIRSRGKMWIYKWEVVCRSDSDFEESD